MSGLEWNTTILETNKTNITSPLGDFLREASRYSTPPPTKNQKFKTTARFPHDPMPKIEAIDFNQSDLVPVNNLRGVSSQTVPSPNQSPVLRSIVTAVCGEAVKLIPFVPPHISTALCVEAFELGIRNPKRIAEYAKKAYIGSVNMVKKVTKNSKKSGMTRAATPKNITSSGINSNRNGGKVGAISTSAPVSVGTVLSGVTTTTRATRNGHTIVGREFLDTAAGSGTIGTWTMVSGVPLTPVAFVDSMLRMYGSMYSFYKWKSITVHYVTTSPTSTGGSVMFYYGKDRASVFLSQTSSNLLPFVLSDPHTCISPQWQSFSVTLEVPTTTFRTDYGMTDDVSHYAAGEIFLLSQTSDSNSPGQLLMDYEIEFSGQNLTPRLLLWPQPTIKYVPYSFSIGTSTTAGNVVSVGFGGTNPFRSSNTSLLEIGGIYKVILDLTNSTVSSTPALTGSNLFANDIQGTAVNTTVTDGTTFYATNVGLGLFFYENVSDAYATAHGFKWQTSFSSVTGGLVAWISLVGFKSASANNPSM